MQSAKSGQSLVSSSKPQRLGKGHYMMAVAVARDALEGCLSFEISHRDRDASSYLN